MTAVTHQARRRAARADAAFAVVLFAFFTAHLLSAQGDPAASPDASYQTPSPSLAALLDAPPTPRVDLDPQRRWLLVLERRALPPIAELAERELRLGGLRLKPQTHGRSRTDAALSLKLVRLADLSEGPERAVTGLPAGARIENVTWTDDGSRFAFTQTGADAIELWVGETASASAHRVGDFKLNLSAGVVPQWLGDDRSLICALWLEGRGVEPLTPPVPAGPIEQESLGRTAPARTYQDLLKSPADEALFDYHLTSQLARVSLDGKVERLGEPGILWGLEVSPDSRYLLVETLHRPYSYLVPAYRFPRRVEVWDTAGKLVHRVADLPLQDEISINFDSVPAGPRNVTWRADAPAELAWVEALDGGEAAREANERDRLYLLAAPFTAAPRALATLGFRVGDVAWGTNDLALVSEFWQKTRRVRTWIVRPGAAQSAPPALLFDRSFEDRYADPGAPDRRPGPYGRPVLLLSQDGRSLYLLGEGASSEGDRPFVDLFDLASRKARRLFRSEAPYYEEPLTLLDAEGKTLLVRREAVAEPPNFFVRDLGAAEAAPAAKRTALRQITRFPHPTPQLVGLQKELIRYARADGVQLTATLYLPPGYKKEDGPLPMVMWVYPQEFKSADAAGQVADSPYRFVRASWFSPVLWVTQGYAVLDNPSLPIVGEGDKEPNDTYVDQLIASARAAVDEVVRRGVADRRRIAVGGHSYGAFTTANLLAHSDLFAAGIAQSGAYNRTLTPFGFQAEERDIWHASQTYIEMSPFLWADRIKEPILLIHGQMDNNPGTDPIQSERFYSALKGNGATARLVMLPLESHGYRARESVQHLFWEVNRWLEAYVKNRPAEAAASATPAASAPTPAPPR